VLLLSRSILYLPHVPVIIGGNRDHYSPAACGSAKSRDQPSRGPPLAAAAGSWLLVLADVAGGARWGGDRERMEGSRRRIAVELHIAGRGREQRRSRWRGSSDDGPCPGPVE